MSERLERSTLPMSTVAVCCKPSNETYKEQDIILAKLSQCFSCDTVFQYQGRLVNARLTFSALCWRRLKFATATKYSERSMPVMSASGKACGRKERRVNRYARKAWKEHSVKLSS
jgi:hypothetical protein